MAQHNLQLYQQYIDSISIQLHYTGKPITSACYRGLPHNTSERLCHLVSRCSLACGVQWPVCGISPVISQLFYIYFSLNFFSYFSLISLKFTSYFTLISHLFLDCFSLISRLFPPHSLISQLLLTYFSVVSHLFLTYFSVVSQLLLTSHSVVFQ